MSEKIYYMLFLPNRKQHLCVLLSNVPFSIKFGDVTCPLYSTSLYCPLAERERFT